MATSGTRTIELRGQSLRIAVDGREGAPWLVFSNSLATDLHLWEPQMEALATAFRILRYDFRGHGGSGPSVDETCDARVLAGDLLAVMDEVHAARAHHVGVSMGALAGVAAAARMPHRFASLVVCNCRLRSSANSGTDLERRAELALSQGMPALTELTLRKWFGSARRPLADSMRQTIAGMIDATDAGSFAAYARGMSDYDLTKAATSLPSPVLLLAGSDDGTIPADFQALRASHPRLQCALIDGAGHLPNLHAAEEFNAALSGFFQQVEPTYRPLAGA